MANNTPSFIFKAKRDFAGKSPSQNQTGFGQTTPYSRSSNKTQSWGMNSGGGDYAPNGQPRGLHHGTVADGWSWMGEYLGKPKESNAGTVGGGGGGDGSGMWDGMSGGPGGGFGPIEPVFDARFTNSQISQDRAAEYENNGELRQHMKQFTRPGISLGASALNRATAPVARSLADASTIGPAVMAQHDLANRANSLEQQEIMGQAAFQDAQVNQQLAGIQNANALSAAQEQNRLMQMLMQGLG